LKRRNGINPWTLNKKPLTNNGMNSQLNITKSKKSERSWKMQMITTEKNLLRNSITNKPKLTECKKQLKRHKRN